VVDAAVGPLRHHLQAVALVDAVGFQRSQ
jgi:hypothetical protein